MRRSVARLESLFVRAVLAVSCLVFLLVFSGGGAALALDPSLSPWPWPTMPQKPLPDGDPAPLVPRVQGDTIEDPFIMPAVPFAASGNTCSFNHDYDVTCPYFGVAARDVVYRYVCDAPIIVTIDLCQSTYDTKVYVFEDALYNYIACNDDYCAYQSYLGYVPLAAGHVYFIVVDGYSTSECGDYVLSINEYEPCLVDCPPGAMPEGEPDCYDGYADTHNGGCGVEPIPVFQILEPSCDPIVICGTTGVFIFESTLYRDTDWFQIDLTEPANICLAGDAEVPMYFLIIDGRGGCGVAETVAYGSVGECEPIANICYDCGPGTWWLWTGPNAWNLSYECGSVYWMEVTGYTEGASPTEGSTWGEVKGLFR
jgi:hypothetical protein